MSIKPPVEIAGYECKNIAYQKAIDGSIDDAMFVKEIVHYTDGSTEPRTRLVENFERPFYITLPHLRNHQEKKEFEPEENLQKFMSTDSNLSNAIQLALGSSFPNPHKQLRQICDSPYIYYADFTAPMYLKSRYMMKWPELKTMNKVAVLDIETNEYEKTKEVLMCSVVVDNKCYLAVTKKYYDEMCLKQPDYKKRITSLLTRVPFVDKKTGEIKTRDLIKEFDLDVEFIIEPKISVALARMMREVHKHLPDFLAIWNMDFDMSKILEVLKKEKMAPEDVFCHPDVPPKYRKVNYRRDVASRITNNGTNKTKAPQDQWHVFEVMASFYVIDAMSLYKKIRVANGNMPNYKLATILKHEIGVGKLDIEEMPYTEDLKWHIDMQKDYKAEYCAYNIMDDLLILLLDKKTYDMQSAVSVLSEWSPFSIFASLPKRLCAALTVYLEKDKCIIGTAGTKIKNLNDEEVIGLDNWIVTLPAHNTMENGANVVSEVKSLVTAIRKQVADADLTQAYPLGSSILNQSRETRIMELCRVRDGEEWDRRRAGINLTSGKVNSIEIANTFLKMPDIDVVLEAFEERNNVDYRLEFMRRRREEEELAKAEREEKAA